MAIAFKLKDYLLCVSRIDFLTHVELTVALEKAATGDEKARRLLEERHLRHVVAWVQPYRSQGLHFLDLIESGNRALLRAIRGWKPDLGAFDDFAEREVCHEVETRLNTLRT